ncbi:MAG: hypothetical protein JNK54_05135 [Elusimicrobia bacterium]|jgi:FtsH-binding integral membrane protein|nr:hypothetical protein [Elusimicrobiota bacterium]
MKLLITKKWSPVDIAALKLYVFSLGMVIGAFVPAFVKNYLWVFIGVAVITGTWAVYAYWFRKDSSVSTAG